MNDQTFPAAQRPVYWDGVARSYIPPEKLKTDPGLAFHAAREVDVDPISFEVIRYALLNTNFEHCRLIQRLSVSPVVMIARDCQSSILMEDGELLFLGPNIQYFSNSQSLCAKWTLEYRSDSPGIAPGDIFISNDPYVGSPHHQDTTLLHPIFVHGGLFCWVANTLHYSDVGGNSPGSFCISATDAWLDPPAFPPVKIVQDGKICRDVEELFIRQSRMPVNVLMDLRAAITACQVTGRRIHDLVQRSGADVVKSVMRRIVDASEKLLEERLEELPDGHWSARTFVEASIPGDWDIYPYQINVRKEGTRIFVDNKGSAPQTGAINITFASFSGTFLATLVQSMVPDLAGAFGGAYRRVEFQPVSGLVNCAERPAAVSASGAVTSEVAINLAAHAVARMLSCGNDRSRNRIIGMPQPAFYGHVYAGADSSGVGFVNPVSDNMVGSQGGTATADGIDAGGAFWMPGAIAENVEQVESHYPMLYVHRKFLAPDHAGAGRHRGGLGIDVAVTPWKAAHFEVALATNEGFTRANGVLGGNPGSRAGSRLLGEMPFEQALGMADLPPPSDSEAVILPKDSGYVVGNGSIIQWTGGTTAGFGDPVLRDPEACRADVLSGLFDRDTIREVYGVELGDGPACEVDVQATRDLRAAMLVARIGHPPVPARPLPQGAQRAGDMLYRFQDVWLCGNCGHEIAPANANYKQGALQRQAPLDRLAPGFESPHARLRDLLEFRWYHCKSCGITLDTEIARPTDEGLHDIAIGVPNSLAG